MKFLRKALALEVLHTLSKYLIKIPNLTPQKSSNIFLFTKPTHCPYNVQNRHLQGVYREEVTCLETMSKTEKRRGSL